MIKTRSFTCGDRLNQTIDELMNKLGYSSVTALIQTAINDLHRKNFPAYSDKGLLTGKGSLTPEEQAGVKYRISKTKKDIEKQEKIDIKTRICEVGLKGKVIEGEEGELVCAWNSYHLTGEYAQKLPLMSISNDLTNNLFIPSKEAVLMKRPELAKELGLE